jgi:hypothetical protein
MLDANLVGWNYFLAGVDSGDLPATLCFFLYFILFFSYSDIDARLRLSTGYFYPAEPRYNRRNFTGQWNHVSLLAV